MKKDLVSESQMLIGTFAAVMISHVQFHFHKARAIIINHVTCETGECRRRWWFWFAPTRILDLE
jgi:hypothetical protein